MPVAIACRSNKHLDAKHKHAQARSQTVHSICRFAQAQQQRSLFLRASGFTRDRFADEAVAGAADGKQMSG